MARKGVGGNRPRKRVFKTVLAVTEGESEEAFLRHLKSLFPARDLGVSITIHSAHGGSPEDILDHAVKRGAREFDNAFVVLDTDVPWPRQLNDKAEASGIVLVGLSPCFEGFLLSLLESPKSFENFSSRQCKSRFKKYIAAGEATLSEAYRTHFSRRDVMDMRGNSEALSSILTLMFHGNV